MRNSEEGRNDDLITRRKVVLDWAKESASAKSSQGRGGSSPPSWTDGLDLSSQFSASTSSGHKKVPGRNAPGSTLR